MKQLLLSACAICFFVSATKAQLPHWEHISGPSAGTVENFDLDGPVLYALTKAGIYRSEDEGYHWELLPASLLTTRDKRQLRAEKGIFYALNKEGTLIRSDNQGASWKPLLQKPFPLDFDTEHLQTLFVQGDTVLVGSYFTIYRSTDRGDTWATGIDLVPADFESIFAFKNEFFAAQDRYIYRSSDGGANWDTVFANAVGYAAVTATDSFILAFYAPQNRMVRSTDGFRTWDAIDTDTLAHFLEEDPYGAVPRKWVGGTGKQLYYFQFGNSHYFCPFRFCYSSDGGNTWHRGANGKQVALGRRLNDGINFGQHIVLASDEIKHSVDSAHTFFISPKSIQSAPIRQILHQNGAVFANTNWQQGHISTDKGNNWDTYQLPTHWGENCLQRLWFAHTAQRVFRFQEDNYSFEAAYTDNGGQTWKTFDMEDDYGRCSTQNAYFFLEKKWTSSGTVKTLWKLDDRDTILKEIQLQGLDISDFYSLKLINLGDRFAVDLGDKFHLFGEDGSFIRQLPANICVSLPFGNLGNLYLFDDTYYNLCADRAFVLPPNANDWQEIYPQDWTTGAPFYLTNLTFLRYHEGLLWVGIVGKGLFYATDHTGRFYPAQPQMPYPYPTAISFADNEIWVGTDGGGIWTLPLPQTDNDSPGALHFKAFPNPSMGDLNLQSDQFLKEEIQLLLFDASGRQLAEETLPPGQYWSLSYPDLPKGLYFLSLRSASGIFGLKWVAQD